MSIKIDEMLGLLMKDLEAEASADVVSTARNVSAATVGWLNDTGISNGRYGRYKTTQISNTFSTESLSTIGGNRIVELLETCKVPASRRGEAAAAVGIILARAALAGGNCSAMMESHSSQAKSAVGTIALESLLPENVRGDVTGSFEHFGVDTDKLEADLVTAITITLMKFHNTITPRLLHTVSSTNPLISVRRDEYLVYDLADDSTAMTPVLSLYDSPDMVENELQKIVPLAATNKGIVVDGFVPMSTDINLFAASINASKYGHGTTNRTDLIAEAARVESILLKLTWNNGEDTPVANEMIEIPVPGSRGRLQRMRDAVSYERSANVDFVVRIGNTTKNVSGVASGALGGFFGDGVTDTDGYLVRVRITPTLNIRTSDVSVYGGLTLTLVDADGEAVTDGYTETDIAISLSGVKFDVRYSEENFRKTSIISTQEVKELNYTIPQGRFYSADRPIISDPSGEERTKQIANLQRIAGIGQDSVTRKTLVGFLDTVNDEAAAFAVDPKNNPRPGLFYAAGGKVNPTVVYADLDFTKMDAFDDSRKKEAIGGRTEGVFQAVVTDLMSGSKIQQQLGDAVLEFRALCSCEVLGKIIAMGSESVDAPEGCEYAMKLPDGHIIGFVTTTFTDQANDITLMVYIKGAPSSDLNFAQNRNIGTFAAAFTAAHPDTASAERIMASVREFPIPLNIVGAVITVKGVDQATFKAEVTA